MNKVIPISENIIFKSLKINADIERKNLLNGGPVDMNKLFVIHNQPQHKESLVVHNGLCLTSSIEVIESISWLILDTQNEIVFNEEPEELVRSISKEVGYDIDKIQNSEIITKH